MAIPTVDQLLQPTMDALHTSGGTAAISTINKYVLAALQLPSKETAEHDQRHSLTRVERRLALARTCLKKFGLAENVRRGVWALTEKGKETTQIDPEEVLTQINLQNRSTKAKAGEAIVAGAANSPVEGLPQGSLNVMQPTVREVDQKTRTCANLHYRIWKLLDYLSLFMFVGVVAIAALMVDYVMVKAVEYTVASSITRYPIVAQFFDWLQIGMALLAFFTAGVHALYSAYFQIRFEYETNSGSES